MNQDTIKGKWTELKGDIRGIWGKITKDDLERTKGNLESIGGLIHQRYGQSKDEIKRQLNDLVSRYERDAADQSEKTKKDLRQQK